MPEDRTYQESNLCSIGTRPDVMTSMFVSELRNHFASSDNLKYEVFRSRLWTGASTDVDSTGILIEDATVWTPTRTQRRPAILARRNGWKHSKRLTLAHTGINSRGDTEHVKFWTGSHTLFCVTPEGTECEILVAEAYEFLQTFAHLFRSEFKLMRFELLEVGPLSIVQETSVHYTVPITVGYGWHDAWRTVKYQPPLLDSRLQDIFDNYHPE